MITDIALTSSVESDKQALSEIQQRQAEREVAPARRFADEGYVSGPAPAAYSPQSRPSKRTALLVDRVDTQQTYFASW